MSICWLVKYPGKCKEYILLAFWIWLWPTRITSSTVVHHDYRRGLHSEIGRRKQIIKTVWAAWFLCLLRREKKAQWYKCPELDQAIQASGLAKKQQHFIHIHLEWLQYSTVFWLRVVRQWLTDRQMLRVKALECHEVLVWNKYTACVSGWWAYKYNVIWI